jgi:hypothetical protein
MKRTLGMMAVGILITGSLALAQPGGAPGAGGQGFGGARGNQDPQQMQRQIQQTMSDTLKQQMGASDEEWTVLWPKIQKVQDAQNAAG